ncbi:methylmalonyl-CoA mutase [Solihabitans fulvus]|uniref:Methylmalonyl-CoA mutase n=1 Tax=Solihabitans fulvus TaxID=1892852 RepID=A0A5B2WQC8_9PSEU|nr:cobalamin-dependent protein [Solihabitans fulvus]KAA2253941.1 methylmalonyl-CoA mutase [Solihabitans fulvus]
MHSPVPQRRRVVLSTVSSDSHTWNLVFLQLLLQELGHEVVNLGPCVPDDLVVAAVREHRPHAVVISSVNGHGHLDGVRLARALRAHPDTRDVPAVIGGKLGVAGADDGAMAAELIAAGFDRVFIDAGELDALTGYLAMLPARDRLQVTGAR